MLVKSLNVVLTLLFLLILGYFLRAKNIIKKNDVSLLSFLAISISVPANIFVSTMSNFDRALLIKFAPSLFLPLTSTLLLFLMSYFLSKLIKLPKNRFGVFASIFSFGNIGLIGLPVASSVLGVDSLVYSSVFFLSNTILFWTLSVYLIKRDATIMSENGNYKDKKTSFTQKLKTVASLLISPTILTFLVTIILILSEVKPPSFLFNSVKYLSNIGTPFAMIYLGSIVCDSKSMKFKYSIDLVLLSVGRFIIAPLLMILLLSFTNYTYELKESFILYSGIAAMTQIGVIAGIHGADKEYAAYAIMSTIFLYPISLIIFQVLLKLI